VAVRLAGFIVTRGFGPGATPTNLIARGFMPAAFLEIIRIVRSGKRSARRIYEENWELIKISAALSMHNGKHVMRPLFENIRKTFTKTGIDIKNVSAKTVEHKRAKDINVSAAVIKVRNKNVKH